VVKADHGQGASETRLNSQSDKAFLYRRNNPPWYKANSTQSTMVASPISVTSFVSSYIRNLQESSLPSKLELQGLVADEKFIDPFNTDFRQFSKNFEASAFYPDAKIGRARSLFH